MSETDQTTLEEQEREDRPTRHVPRNWRNSENPEAERIEYENRKMEKLLGIPFINTMKQSGKKGESVMEELGVDQL